MHTLHNPACAARRMVSVLVFMFVLVVTANAYTLVMRSGRRVEIPPRFIVTGSTLTYEASPGMQVTLQMTTIDIPATERANNEGPGSFLRRSQSAQQSSQSDQTSEEEMPTTPAKRTITNRDLEATMRRRRESEKAYDNRLKQLGLPPLAESRRQAAIESEALDEELAGRRAAKQQAESYWRERATALRTEMAALDAEIAWIRGRLDEGPFGSSNELARSSVTSVIPFISFDNFGRRSYGNYGDGRFRSRGRRQDVFIAPGQGSASTGRAILGGGRGRFNPGLYPGRGRGLGGIFPGYPGYPGYPYPNYPGYPGYPSYPGSDIFGSNSSSYESQYERGELITRFNELSATRAGLNARWRQLEEEARRAGASPGWLRE